MNKYNDHDDIPGNPSVAKTSEVKLRTHADKDSLRVLSLEQWNFWIENGYVVIKNAISKQQAAKTASFLWEYEEKDPNDKNTWYTSPRAKMQMKDLSKAAQTSASSCPCVQMSYKHTLYIETYPHH